MTAQEVKKLEKKCLEVSALLKEISHPTRLLILCSLVEKEMSVGDLVDRIGISQSLMSQFLGRMRDEGLLSSQRAGKSILYRIDNKDVLQLLKSFKKIFC